MSICIRAYMYVYMNMYICINDVWMFTWVYVSIWMHMCMHVWNVCCVCINMYVYMGECVHLHSDCHMSTSLYPAPPGPRPHSHPQHFRQWSLSCPFPRDRDLRGLRHPLMDTPASAGNIWLFELGLAAPPTEEPTAGPLTPHTLSLPLVSALLHAASTRHSPNPLHLNFHSYIDLYTWLC